MVNQGKEGNQESGNLKKDLGVGNGDKTFRVHGVTDLNFEISVVRGNWRIRKERKDLKGVLYSVIVKLENHRRKLLRCRGEEDGSGNADRFEGMSLLLLLSRFSRVRLYATP